LGLIPWQSEHDDVCAGCSIVHEGHFQIGPLIGLVERGGEIPNVGNFDTVLLVFVCWTIEELTLTFDFSTTEETIGFDGCVDTKDNKKDKKKIWEKMNVLASVRHFSGYLLAYSSCARANFGHENGVILPRT
jgi:hypothetical protein